MHIEVHAPSSPVLVATLVLSVLALLCYLVTPYAPIAFWLAILANFVMAFGTIVKT